MIDRLFLEMLIDMNDVNSGLAGIELPSELMASKTVSPARGRNEFSSGDAIFAPMDALAFQLRRSNLVRR